MELLGVHEASIRWIGSILSDRSQRVRIGQVTHPVTPNGGIPQGKKLAPLLFAILVNNLCRDWRYRIKYVDDTSVFESILRCWPSYLLFIAANTYPSMSNIRLNEKKCKDMVLNFLKYQPTVITPIQLNGIVIDRVSSYKLLGVIISNDLSWNEHCDSIHKKATKRLFVLRTLKRVGLGTNDLVLVYCSISRSIFEYASPVWAAIPLYLDGLTRRVAEVFQRVFVCD